MTGSFKETAENLNVPADVQGSLTAAEQAAAEAIKAAYARAGWRMPDDFDDEARAVVAAVRGPIYREVSDVLDKRVGSAPLHTIDGLIFAANELAEMAAERQAEGDDRD